MRRNRIAYFTVTIFVMILGLVSRRVSGLPSFIESYSGDTLWALMMFLMFAFIFNKKSTSSIAVYAILFSYAIELSQLYHAPWIDSIRSTTIGALVLGFGFLWSDIICYTVGIAIAVVLDKVVNR